MKKPDGWPEVLFVWENSGGWDGLAVDPDDSPEEYLDAWLHDVGEKDHTGESLWASDNWVRVEWDEERGTYYCPRFERASGAPFQYERSYAPDDLSYLPDQYFVGELNDDDA